MIRVAPRRYNLRRRPGRGPVSFVVRPHPAGRRTEVELTAPSRRAPESVLLRLRDPLFRTIAAVTVNGTPVKTFAGETIELTRPVGRLLIEVTSQ